MNIIRKNIKTIEIVSSVIILLGFYILFRGVFYDFFRQPSASMVPTLVVGDMFVVSKYGYGNYRIFNYPLWRSEPTKTPQRGEVFAFFPPSEDRYFIKRIIGLPGDTVELRDKKVFINGNSITDLRTMTPEGLVTEKIDDNSYQV